MKLRLTLVAAAAVAIATAAACDEEKPVATPTPTPLSPTAPYIASVTPGAGSVGTTVLVLGSRFGATQSSNGAFFSTVPAPVVAWSDSALAITVPAGLPGGPEPVRVLVGGTASNAAPFLATS